MNYCLVGDTVINLDQVQYITIEERDEDGLPILARIHFASIAPNSTSTQIVISEDLIGEVFKAIGLKKGLLVG